MRSKVSEDDGGNSRGARGGDPGLAPRGESCREKKGVRGACSPGMHPRGARGGGVRPRREDTE